MLTYEKHFPTKNLFTSNICTIYLLVLGRVEWGAKCFDLYLTVLGQTGKLALPTSKGKDLSVFKVFLNSHIVSSLKPLNSSSLILSVKLFLDLTC